MNDNDRSVLDLMLGYCKRIRERISKYSIDKDAFEHDDAHADMLLMPVFQIGELVSRLSDECVEELSEIPWHQIRGFRNIIAHDYMKVQATWAWDTIETSIPELEKKLKDAIRS